MPGFRSSRHKSERCTRLGFNLGPEFRALEMAAHAFNRITGIGQRNTRVANQRAPLLPWALPWRRPSLETPSKSALLASGLTGFVTGSIVMADGGYRVI